MRPETDECNQSNVKAASQHVYVPRVGDVIRVDTGDREFNGSRIHPAIVVRVWGDGKSGGSPCINVRVFVDGDSTLWLTSVVHKSHVAPPIKFRQARPTYYFHPAEEPIDA